MTVELYHFKWSIYRMGTVEALFFEDPRIIELMDGDTLNLGEALGRYSEVRDVLRVNNDLIQIPLSDQVKGELLRHCGRVVLGRDVLQRWFEGVWDEGGGDTDHIARIDRFIAERDLEINRLTYRR